MPQKVTETKSISTRIPKPMLDEVKAVLRNSHLNVSDYLRDLIRRDLQKRDILRDEGEAAT